MAKFISEKIKMKSGARLAAVQATYMIAYGDLPVDEVVKDFVNGEVGRYVIEDNGITEEMIAVSDIDTNYFPIWCGACMPKGRFGKIAECLS